MKKIGNRIQPGQQLIYTLSCRQGALLAVDEWGVDCSILLGKVLDQVDRSRQNCAQKIQLGFMDTNMLRKP